MKNRNYLNKIAIVITATILTACGNSKSNPTNSNSLNTYAAKALANCNKTKDSNFSINTGTVTEQNGQMSSEWIKIKFNFLSTAVTANGNTIKFFKWRVIGSESQLDNAPLEFASYDLASGSTVGGTGNAMNVSQLSTSNGLYIKLNDPNSQFQVIKVVVYNTSGAIVGQLNSLIPGFYASPTDYQLNADGTPRALILQKMHNLYGTDVTGWTPAQFQTSFDQYCF